MDTQVVADYLKEFANPSLKCLPNEPLNPMVIQQYLAEVESLRLAFVTEIIGCTNEALISVYVDELKQAIKTVQQRGYYKLKDENITAAITGGVKEMEFVNDAVLVDRGLLASAEKALKFISPTKEDISNPVVETKTDEPTKKEVKNNASDSSFLNGKEVASLFGVAYNNVKDKKWRDKHGFPYLQPTGEGGKVVFVKEEVEEWVKNNGKRG